MGYDKITALRAIQDKELRNDFENQRVVSTIKSSSQSLEKKLDKIIQLLERLPIDK